MATYNVSTWAELVTAIRSIDTSVTNTIYITKDIDCNDEIPEGVASSVRPAGSSSISSLNLTITGAYTENSVTKNHVIRNLRTDITSPVSIFRFSDGSTATKYIDFRNIDFINLVLDRPLVQMDTWRNTYTRFYSCRFVGRRTQSLIYHSVNSSSDSTTVQFFSCFFNVEYKGTAQENVPLVRKTGNSYDYFYANYCRIKSTYTGWTVGTNFSPSIATDPQNITHTLRLNSCYLYGTFVGGSAQQMGITDYYNYNGSTQNVIDADLRMVGNTSASGTSISVVMPKGIFVNKIRKWGDDSVEYTVSNYNSSGEAKAIPIPPDKMTDPAYLYAHGFDIVVPE